MQYSTLLSLAATLAVATASPTPRTNSATIVFHGAADASYSLSVPLDGVSYATDNVLSISSVSTDSGLNIGAQCTLDTVDVPPALVEGPPGTWVVGPPQTVNSITCSDGSAPPYSPPSAVVTIEFQGADPSQGATYTLTVPLNGQYVPTNNVLSISTIVTAFQGLPGCKFDYVDHSASLSKIASNTWAVGPPQTINGLSCKQ